VPGRIAEALSLKTDINAVMEAERSFVIHEIDRLGNPMKGLKMIANTFLVHMEWLTEFLELVGADLLEVNLVLRYCKQRAESS
jgi:hypothetical protein